MTPGDWAWSTEYEAICRIIDVQSVWNHTLYQVWLPTQDAVMHVRAGRLKPSGPLSILSPITSRTLSLLPELPMP
jgi:hypothetical protein